MRITDQLPEVWDIKLMGGDSWPPDSFELYIEAEPVTDAAVVLEVYKAGSKLKELAVGSGLIKEDNKYTIDALQEPLPAYKSYKHKVIATLADGRILTIYQGSIISH